VALGGHRFRERKGIEDKKKEEDEKEKKRRKKKVERKKRKKVLSEAMATKKIILTSIKNHLESLFQLHELLTIHFESLLEHDYNR